MAPSPLIPLADPSGIVVPHCELHLSRGHDPGERPSPAPKVRYSEMAGTMAGAALRRCGIKSVRPFSHRHLGARMKRSASRAAARWYEQVRLTDRDGRMSFMVLNKLIWFGWIERSIFSHNLSALRYSRGHGS
jgi:hypothetical protein